VSANKSYFVLEIPLDLSNLLALRIEKIPESESDAYWASRPRGSQIGGWASDQSMVVGEDELDRNVEEVTKRFEADENVPRPPHWGGWRVVPKYVPPVCCEETHHESSPLSTVKLSFGLANPAGCMTGLDT